ncbi:MAG: 16S rRNA (guanine(527)-N(7))-methyltransferase RsmG [Oscillospiraceae bacterium]|nr:16S rRNA (guanine(527)-N(7))-methyltransferase RsmG [Oscillospiraceae bacterium]
MNEIIEAFLKSNETLLNTLTCFMLDYNRHTNLTRITEPQEVIEKHYIDSILPFILLRNKSLDPHGKAARTSLIDVGSGAGFPGIPMKLFRPDLSVTLLDSSQKRTDYLKLLLNKIAVDAEVITGRSEELSHSPVYREKYDIVAARAVANLPALCEYCLPFAKVGGLFLAMKGGDCETHRAATALTTLGGEIEDVIEYTLPSGDSRNLVIIRKARQTPTNYPRRRVNLTKNPME